MTRMQVERRKFGPQHVFGFMVGLSQSRISLCETGRRTPRPEIAARIASVLGVPVGELFLEAEGSAAPESGQ